jgi:hypothetical protein
MSAGAKNTFPGSICPRCGSDQKSNSFHAGNVNAETCAECCLETITYEDQPAYKAELYRAGDGDCAVAVWPLDNDTTLHRGIRYNDPSTDNASRTLTGLHYHLTQAEVELLVSNPLVTLDRIRKASVLS